jgi:hypothetical protein
MSAAVLEHPRRLVGGTRGPARSARVVRETMGGGGRATLEDSISNAWEGLSAHRAVACVVCRGALAPRYGASGAAPVGGRCRDCGSVLG